MLCREPDPAALDGPAAIFRWNEGGRAVALRGSAADVRPGTWVVHQLPHHPDVRPVYVTDKQREGPVRPFIALDDETLQSYRAFGERCVGAVLDAWPVDVLHANHLTPQPEIARPPCLARGVPYVIYPHGSAIEYALRRDERFRRSAGEAIADAAGLIIGSEEVRRRIFDLYPEHHDRLRARSLIIGVGVDTDLFQPLARGERGEALARLAALGPGGGKGPAQVDELRLRPDRGDLAALSGYRDAYAHDRPDADAVDHLGRVPFEDGRVLLFVGALTVGKGLQSLIVALPAILREVQDAHLVIVGSGAYREVLEGLVHALARRPELLDPIVARGYDLDETHLSGAWPDVAAYLADPERRATALSAGPALAEHVHFVGRLDHRLLRHLFPCADVAVFPSIIPEAYPLVLMESLANGVLPAASDFSGFREGLDGLVGDLGEERVRRMRLPMEDGTRVGGIAEGLAGLLRDPELREVGPRLRELAASRFDWAVRAREMVAGYEALAAAGR